MDKSMGIDVGICIDRDTYLNTELVCFEYMEV